MIILFASMVFDEKPQRCLVAGYIVLNENLVAFTSIML